MFVVVSQQLVCATQSLRINRDHGFESPRYGPLFFVNIMSFIACNNKRLIDYLYKHVCMQVARNIIHSHIHIIMYLRKQCSLHNYVPLRLWFMC